MLDTDQNFDCTLPYIGRSIGRMPIEQLVELARRAVSVELDSYTAIPGTKYYHFGQLLHRLQCSAQITGRGKVMPTGFDFGRLKC